jgi:hypothetical protein
LNHAHMKKYTMNRWPCTYNRVPIGPAVSTNV